MRNYSAMIIINIIIMNMIIINTIIINTIIINTIIVFAIKFLIKIERHRGNYALGCRSSYNY